MKTYISLIRGINVSGQKKVKMADLKTMYESLDFKNVQTYIQSGNVIFEYTETDSLVLSKSIEEKILEVFGYDVTVLNKTKEEIQEIIKHNPFQDFPEEGPKKLYVTLLAGIPDEELVKAIEQLKSQADQFHISGKEIYLYCPNGYGSTKLSNNFFERKLKVRATTRNWKTINTLRDLANNN